LVAKKNEEKGKRRAPSRPSRGASTHRPPRKGKVRPRPAPTHLTPLPKDCAEVVGWFHNLSRRIDGATEEELRALIREAKKFDLVGLTEALGNEDDALALNRAANTLLDAAIAASPPGSEGARLLSVLRDILNDS
jgi:hypothetical protein